MKNYEDVKRSVDFLFKEYYYRDILKYIPRKTCVFIINGLPDTGKDTFIECCSRFTNVNRISSVDLIKDMAKIVDLHENKVFLRKLKDLTYKYTNYIDNYIVSKIEKNKLNFVHVNEEKFFNKDPYKGFYKIFVERSDNKSFYKHSFNYDLYDHIVLNVNLKSLPYQANTFIEIYCDRTQ